MAPHSQPDLRAATDDHWGPLLQRAQEFATPACVLGPSGHVVAALGTLDESIETLLGSLPMREALSQPLATTPDVLVPVRGLRLVVVPLDLLSAQPGTRLVAIGLDAPGPEFDALCASAGADPALTREALLRSGPLDPRAARLLMTALFGAVRDLASLREKEASLAGFTTQLSECYDTIDLVYAVGRRAHAPLDVPGFLRFVVDRLRGASNFSWVGLCLDASPEITTPLRGRSVVAGTLGADAAPRIGALMHPGATPGPVVLPFAAGLSAFAGDQVVVQHIVCKGRSVGVLAAGDKGGVDRIVNSYDTQIVEALAGFISGFCESVWLYEDQREMFLGTVRAITSAIDAKDRYTFGHSERVAHVAQQLALAHGMDQAQSERVYIAGLVHDVGKIGVPEAILTKPGRLTEDEFAAIKLHPEIGHRILKDIPLLRDILPGVLHHHERFDGRGYPARLSGDSIPLMARLIAVADTFDAMSSTRSYRAAMSRDKVLAEITRSAGTQLDPALARLILALDLSGFDALFARHAQMEATALQREATPKAA